VSGGAWPGPAQPGRWVWVPETDQAAEESFRRLKEWTIDHSFSETGARIFRELRNPGLTRGRKAALHEQLLAEIEQRNIEELAAERRRRPLERDRRR
jgi:hypothetical protein